MACHKITLSSKTLQETLEGNGKGLKALGTLEQVGFSKAGAMKGYVPEPVVHQPPSLGLRVVHVLGSARH